MDSSRAGSSKERHLDARALRFVIIFPCLLSLALIAGTLLLRGSFGAGVQLPWGGDAIPLVAFLAVACGTVLLVGLGVGNFATRTTRTAILRRIILGVAMALQLAAFSLFSAAILGQGGSATLAPERVNEYVLMMGCGLAAAMGLVLAMTFKPDEQWTPADDAAFARVLAHEADPTAANDRLAYLIHPRNSVVVMILLAGFLPGLLLSLLSPWFLLATVLLALLVLAALCASVHVDRQGLSVKLVGLLPVIHIPRTEVDAAVALDLVAREHGGWGLRKHSGAESFLAASGAGVVLHQNDGGRTVVGAPNLEVADAVAAVLNRRAGKNL